MGGAIGEAQRENVSQDGELGVATDDGDGPMGEPKGGSGGAEHDKVPVVRLELTTYSL